MRRTVFCRSIQSSFSSNLAQGRLEEGWSKYSDAIEEDERAAVDVVTTKMKSKKLSDSVAELKELGCLELTIPKEAGGKGMTTAAQSQVFEQIGRQNLNAALSAYYNTLAHRALAVHSGEEVHSDTPNTVAAYCLTEASTGSDIRSTTTKAEESNDSYIISGEKSCVTNATDAEFFTVFAKLDNSLSLFKVPKSGDISIVENTSFPLTSTVKFNNVKVPKSSLIGPVGGIVGTTSKLNNRHLHLVSSSILGSQKELLSLVCSHCDTKQAFGRTLRDHPLMKKEIAGMGLRVYVLESMLYLGVDPLVTKIVAADISKQNAEAAQRIMGCACSREVAQITSSSTMMQHIPVTKEVAILSHTLETLEKCGSGLRSKSTTKLLFGRLARSLGYTPRTDVGDIHPSLKQQAVLVNKLADKLGACTENVLVKFGKKLIDEQIAVSRVSDCIVSITTMVSVLSRASKSALASSPTHQTEVTMAITWVKTESARLTNIFADLENVYKTTDSSLSRISDHLTETKGYFPSHPCNAQPLWPVYDLNTVKNLLGG